MPRGQRMTGEAGPELRGRLRVSGNREEGGGDGGAPEAI